MATYNGPKRSTLTIYFICVAVAVIFFVTSFRNQRYEPKQQEYDALWHPKLHQKDAHKPEDSNILTGHAIAPKLGNETAKAELGRAAWKLFHTTFARFPDKPTPDEKAALKSYIHLFQRLYPCGECATHFGVILDKFPPQVSSRSAAAGWGCMVHNEVNKSLKKELFDCNNIGDFYDCGCAEDEEGVKDSKKIAKGQEKGHKQKQVDEDTD